MRRRGHQEYRNCPIREFYVITIERQFWKSGRRAEGFSGRDRHKHGERSHNDSTGDILELAIFAFRGHISNVLGSGAKRKRNGVVHRFHGGKRKWNHDGSGNHRNLTVCREPLRHGHEFAATIVAEHGKHQFWNGVYREQRHCQSYGVERWNGRFDDFDDCDERG